MGLESERGVPLKLDCSSWKQSVAHIAFSYMVLEHKGDFEGSGRSSWAQCACIHTAAPLCTSPDILSSTIGSWNVCHPHHKGKDFIEFALLFQVAIMWLQQAEPL